MLQTYVHLPGNNGWLLLPRPTRKGVLITMIKEVMHVANICASNRKLEDLKHSPDIGSHDLNNVKLGRGQPGRIILTYFVLPYMGVASIFGQVT